MNTMTNKLHRHGITGCLAIAAITLPCLSWAAGVQLVTEEEARLPRAPISASRSAFFPGPELIIVSPKQGETVKSPFRIKVEYRAKGGEAVAPESLEVQYMVAPAQNISSRVSEFSTEKSLEIKEANAPAGEHQFVLYVADTKGRRSRAILNLTVAK